LWFWRTYISEIGEANMPWLPEDWIDEVISRNDIIDVVSEYLILKPRGSGYFGLCPFHNEKTASFHVSPERQTYHCFGCHEGGNVVSFIMSMERMEFIDAMKHLAERVSMPLPEASDQEHYQRERDKKQQIFEINRECARYYHQMLMKPEGKEALSYLHSRGLDMRTIRSFGLGFAPDGWDSARIHLKNMGFTDKQLIDAGIVLENTDKGSIYDRFRNRIMFPIMNTRGMVLGFGGRVMDDSQPKYLNSSDSLVFNKGYNLFGLNLAAKVRPLEFLIIAEGYMDVISLHQYGFPQAVASLGTALTPGQAKLMRRYASEIYIAYDGDEAGQKAAMRSLDILREAGCKVQVMQFPNNLDPDDVLKQYGPEYFKKLMGNSLSRLSYKRSKLMEKYDLDTIDGKAAYLTAAAKMLAKEENSLEVEVHVNELASLLGVRPRAILDQIAREKAAGKLQNKEQRNRTGNYRYTKNMVQPVVLKPGYLRAEACLVNLMVQERTIAERILNGLEGLTLQEPLHQRVVEIVRNLLERNGEINEARVLSHLEDKDDIRKLVDIFYQKIEYDNIDAFLTDCLNQVARGIIEKQRQKIQNEIDTMDREGIPDPDRYKSLLKEIQQLNHRLSTYKSERRELREEWRV
jgi:DNA primase